MLEGFVLTDRDLQLSRVYADGWNTGCQFSAYPELTEAQVAALNPHKRDPEYTQWLLGFRGACAAMHDPRRMTKDQTRQSYLQDLLAVLRAHPGGLRRWSVMREMRLRRQKAGYEIKPNFEHEVEWIFCRHCSGDPMRARLGDGTPALFHRPKERSGEVWAANPGSSFSAST
jgi:hypothetical protein